MRNILITGASGLIGTRLSKMLFERGYNIRHLSRKHYRIKGDFSVYLWDPEREFIDLESLDKLHGIIHLAGAPLDKKKWSTQEKIKILQSRSESARLLWKHIRKTKEQPECFISAGGINYYGSITQKKAFTEEDPPGVDFLSQVCQIWEANADLFQKIGIRTVKLRTGIVLSRKGGALQRMEKIIKYYLGAPLGNGKQFMPWIHIDDLCYLYIKTMEDKNWQGSYNAVAPEVINNVEFTKTLARFLHRPLLFPRVPDFALRWFYGKEFSKVLINGSPISVQKTLKQGFIFKYPQLNKALKEIYP